MSQVLEELLEQHVQIWSQDGQRSVKDEGILIAFDDKWVVIQKNGLYNDAETLYFPVANIRLLKPV